MWHCAENVLYGAKIWAELPFLRTETENWKELKRTKAIKIVMFRTYEKLKRTKKNWKELQKFSVLIASLYFFYYVSNKTILIPLVLLCSLQFLWVLFLFSEMCSSTKLPGSTDQFPLGRTLHLSSTRDKEKRQHDCNEKEKTPFQLMAGRSLMSFLRAGQSKYCWLPSNWNLKYIYFLHKEEKLFSCSPICPTRRSYNSSSCGEACHTQASGVCWCCCWSQTSSHNPCRQKHGYCATKCCALSLHTDPIQQQHEFPHKPALNIFRSRWPQTSTSLHVLLKAFPCLEGDVADGKADPSACHKLGQVSVLQYFWGTAGSLDNQHVFRQAGLSW